MQECEKSVPHTAMEWDKRNPDTNGPGDDDVNRVEYVYVRLESESSVTSEDDSESVYSVQDKETDVARDTTDTDTTSQYTFDVEFEIATASENDDDDPLGNYSTSGSDDFCAAEEVIAAVLCETSVEAWASDGEDSYNSSTTDVEAFGRADFWTCAQCLSKNDNPLYRLCEKCFQVRKNFYPPRPRRSKKRRTPKRKEAVNVDKLRSCLNGLSQDSGLGSSQELASLDFDQIKVPEHLTCNSQDSASTSTSGASFSTTSNLSDQDSIVGVGKKRKTRDGSEDERKYVKKIVIEKVNGAVGVNRTHQDPIEKLMEKIEDTKNEVKGDVKKRKLSEDSDDDIFSASKVSKIEEEHPLKKQVVDIKASLKEKETNSEEPMRSSLPEFKELCIICNSKAKDSAFLHGNSGHTCCCYACAIKSWRTNKRCPVCKRPVKNVVKLFIV